MAAEKITPKPSTSWPGTPGLVCLALTEERCDELALPLMLRSTPRITNSICESIDARRGTTTGISTSDARQTISRRSRRDAPLRPGAVPPYFPLRARRWCVVGPANRRVRGPGAHGGAHAAGVICQS